MPELIDDNHEFFQRECRIGQKFLASASIVELLRTHTIFIVTFNPHAWRACSCSKLRPSTKVISRKSKIRPGSMSIWVGVVGLIFKERKVPPANASMTLSEL